MNGRHISDDRLIDICVNRSAEPDETAHVNVCVKCAGRRAEIIAILSELEDAATSAADSAFPLPRLERQHARILHRVHDDDRPGEILTFPTARPVTRLLMPEGSTD